MYVMWRHTVTVLLICNCVYISGNKQRLRSCGFGKKNTVKLQKQVDYISWRFCMFHLCLCSTLSFCSWAKLHWHVCLVVASPGSMPCYLWDAAPRTHRAGSPTATESAGLHCMPENMQRDGDRGKRESKYLFITLQYKLPTGMLSGTESVFPGIFYNFWLLTLFFCPVFFLAVQ